MRKEEAGMGRENILTGRNPVIEALKKGRTIDKVLVQKNAGGSIGKIISLANKSGVTVIPSEKKTLDRIAEGTKHQGAIAYISGFEYGTFNDIYMKAEKAGEEPLIVILDEIEDPHNLGAIMRSAECAGAHGVIIPKRNSCGLTDTVANASAGAIEYMPCVRVTNIVSVIDNLKKDGFWIAACDMGENYYYEQNLKGKLAIVIGNEGAGIGRLVKEKCDFTISIPMQGKINSLNASNAACVALYEARRQRNLEKK